MESTNVEVQNPCFGWEYIFVFVEDKLFKRFAGGSFMKGDKELPFCS